MFLHLVMTDRTRKRRSSGNMLMMVALVGFIVIVILMVGFVIAMVVLSQKRAQNEGEELALSLATTLNKDDYIGQMNNMVEFSRELVFTSRQQYDEAVADYPRLRPLAMQLMDESRTGAKLVEAERQQLVKLSLKKLREQVLDSNDRKASGVDKSSAGFRMPWVTTHAPSVSQLTAGYIDGVQSNASAPDGVPELKQLDIQGKFLSPKGNLYIGNINAKLPSPDDDLIFKLSSLPAAVKGTTSSTRLAAANVFKPFAVLIEAGEPTDKGCDQLPSAVNVDLMMKVTADASKKGPMENQVKVNVTSAAAGAGLLLP